MGAKKADEQQKKGHQRNLEQVEKNMSFGHAKIQEFCQRINLKIIPPPISKKSPKYADHPPPQCWTRICSPANEV